jgi:hypothetical protein
MGWALDRAFTIEERTATVGTSAQQRSKPHATGETMHKSRVEADCVRCGRNVARRLEAAWIARGPACGVEGAGKSVCQAAIYCLRPTRWNVEAAA